MRKAVLIALIAFCSDLSIAQGVDYKEVRKQISTLSCGKVDSAEVARTKTRLEAFDTTTIVKNIDYYYRDLAWCYYRIFLVSNDTGFFKQACDNYMKAISYKPNDTQSLWGCAFYFYHTGDCVKGKYYMDLYKKNLDPKFWDNVQIEMVISHCPG